VGAWVLGARNTLKALLIAMLTPIDGMRRAEAAGDGFARMAISEETRMLPHGAVWDHYCQRSSIPTDAAAREEIVAYGRKVAGERG
jgi:L-rhamnose isomerase